MAEGIAVKPWTITVIMLNHKHIVGRNNTTTIIEHLGRMCPNDHNVFSTL